LGENLEEGGRPKAGEGGVLRKSQKKSNGLKSIGSGKKWKKSGCRSARWNYKDGMLGTSILRVNVVQTRNKCDETSGENRRDRSDS